MNALKLHGNEADSVEGKRLVSESGVVTGARPTKLTCYLLLDAILAILLKAIRRSFRCARGTQLTALCRQNLLRILRILKFSELVCSLLHLQRRLAAILSLNDDVCLLSIISKSFTHRLITIVSVFITILFANLFASFVYVGVEISILLLLCLFFKMTFFAFTITGLIVRAHANFATLTLDLPG